MREDNYGYVYSSKLEDSLWESAIIIFDTSALIELYYYTANTVKEIELSIFKNLNERLWIPSQVEFEFLKHRNEKRLAPILSYKDLLEQRTNNRESGYLGNTKKILADFETQLNELNNKTKKDKKHPYLSENIVDEFTERCFMKFKEEYLLFYKNFHDKVNTIISEIQDKKDDEIWGLINQYFIIGDGFTFSEQMNYVQEGSFRYSNKIPPGYEDEKKEGLAKYGDLIIWKEILKYAKENSSNIIYVTKDTKLDWCYRLKGRADKIERPREELIFEFNSVTYKNFWMYSISDFFHVASKFCKPVDEVALREIENVSTFQFTKIEIAIEKWLRESYKGYEILFEHSLILNNNSSRVDFLLHGNLEDIGVEIRGLKLSSYHIINIIERIESILTDSNMKKYILIFTIEKIEDLSYYLDKLPQTNPFIEYVFGFIDLENETFHRIKS